jgi:hypothetical protein
MRKYLAGLMILGALAIGATPALAKDPDKGKCAAALQKAASSGQGNHTGIKEAQDNCNK